MEQDTRSLDRLPAVLAGLGACELQAPPGFADRVMAAVVGRRAARRSAARLRVQELRLWARRHGPARRRALASSALLAGAVALGLEARHLRRTREVEPA